MADSTLKVTILAVDKASKSLGKVAGAAEKMSKAGLIAAGGIAAFGVSSVKAYSEAEAAQAKLQDTFDKFPRLANVSIESLRDYNSELQSKTRFDDDAIASGQAILGQYEITGKQLQELTPLVADFAAKTGQSFEEASAAVGKGLLGSGKAFKQIGLDFEDTGTQAGNLEQIMGGLRTQVGGFAETEAKTGAGAAERLKNQFGELQETVGAQLLPPLTELAGVATNVLTGFNNLPGPVKTVTGGIVLLGTAALIAAPRIAATAAAIKSVKGSVGGISKASAISAGAFSGIAAAVGLVAAGAADAAAARKELEDFSPQNMDAFKGKIEETRLKVQDLEDGITGITDGLDWFKNAANYATLDEAFRFGLREVQGYETALVDLQGTSGASAELTREVADAVWDQNRSYVDNKDAVLQALKAKSKGTDAAIKLAEAELDAADGAATAADKTRAYKDALDALNNPSLSVRETQRGLEAAYDNATESIKENGRTLDISTPKGRANADALDEVAQAAARAAGAQREKDGNDKRANETLRIARERLVKQAQATGMSREAARKYVDQVLKIPATKGTKVTVDTAGASRKIKAFVREFNGQKITYYLTPGAPAALSQYIINPKSLPPRALGGPVSRGKTYIVGEKGPEVFTAPSSGMIIPNGGSARGVAGAGGSQPVIIQGGTFIGTDLRRAARELNAALKAEGARGLATA